jgi:hypothetical protein
MGPWDMSWLFRGICHQTVFDSVVDHLDEVARAVRPAVQVAVLGSAAELRAAGGARRRFDAGRKRGKDRVEVFHNRILAADHQAVVAMEPPDQSCRFAWSCSFRFHQPERTPRS